MKELINRLLGFIPSWLGFVFLLAAGVALLVGGILTKMPGLIAFGAATVLAGAIAWIAGAVARPTLSFSPKGFGGSVAQVPDPAWIVIFLLFVAASLVAIFT